MARRRVWQLALVNRLDEAGGRAACTPRHREREALPSSQISILSLSSDKKLGLVFSF